uniref:Ribonuclease H protein At1g65750 family n=1 Tax=Cajanus cajan TaxID=3821 RepID=A0A151RKV4_CAJCA|nr:Putative ribonuclease H protein At1g65750 family [Cajanus cajan]
MWGLKNSKISLLWNGSTLPSFVPSRGLRQGDPLSPYLFVFCMERLALRISEMLQAGQWKPIQLSPGGLPLSHLLFADDILLFCHASEDQARLVASVLEEFSRSSGLKVNLTKSKFVSSRRVSQRRIETLEGLLGIGHTNRIGKYLGVPMTHGQPRCADFYDVMDKIQGRLAAWKSKLLNKAGKLCLVKSTICSIPVYSMQTLWLPQAVCNRIDQACRRMLWAKSDCARFWSPVSWDVVTQPLTFGGLGVREARRVNVSLLGKLIWDLLTAPQKPWVHILSNIYLHGESILCAQNRRGASPTWSSLIKVLPSLREGFEPHLGSGASSLWYTDWSGAGLWCGRVPFVHIADTNRTVADCWVSGHWDFTSLYTAIPAELIHSVQRLTVATSSLELDHFAWRGDSSGCYTAASGYRFLTTCLTTEGDEVWKKLWKLMLPEKVKFFLWQCFHSALPKNQVRADRRLAESGACSRCSCPHETILHALRDCPYSREALLSGGASVGWSFSVMDCFQ